MHCSGYKREKFLDLVSCTDEEWSQIIDNPKDALNTFGSLWKCTDIVPSHDRRKAASWLESVHGIRPDTALRLNSGCTYAQLAWYMKPALERISAQKKK